MANELCKCGKVGEISCPHDERCGSDSTQLPAEVVKEIEANSVYVLDFMSNDESLSDDELKAHKAGYISGATEYATKLHQAHQEISELKRWKAEAAELLNPMLDYGQSKEVGIPLGESITAVVLDRSKRFDAATQMLFRLASLVNADQKPDDKFLTEIKTFLDGTK
jgi:hypothetical protein